MREIGKVTQYNGFYGKIINSNGDDYLLLKEQIIGDNDIKEFDLVTYAPEIYNNNETNQKIARFVKKIPIKNN